MEAFNQYFEGSLEVKKKYMAEQGRSVVAAGQIIGDALIAGHKVLICGNGGSAADAQHMAAELIGRFEKDFT